MKKEGQQGGRTHRGEMGSQGERAHMEGEELAWREDSQGGREDS